MKAKNWVDPKYKFLGKKAMEQYPELDNMSVEEAARFIQEKAYKGLPKLRETLGMGNQIINDPQALARASLLVYSKQYIKYNNSKP